MSIVKQYLDIAQSAAVEAGRTIMEVYDSGVFLSTTKEDSSPLTIADQNAHRVITKCLGGTNLPLLSEEGRNIAYDDRKGWEYFWLIDPLDGTKEFINKNGEFTVNIALMYQNSPVAGVVYAPGADILYYGSQEGGVYKKEKGRLINIPPLFKRTLYHDILQKEQITIAVSRSHLSPETKDFVKQFKNVNLLPVGSALKFMMLLEGQADIYPRLGKTMEWDTAAAHAILHASNRGVYLTDLKSEIIYNKPNLANPFFIAF